MSNHSGIPPATPEQALACRSMALACAWTRADWVALAAVTLPAGALRVFRLEQPPVAYFDEVVYAADACWYVKASPALCHIAKEITPHPPLAKWLIGAGIEAFGYNPVGWRIAAAIAGTATVTLLYLLARRLFRSTFAATIASGLLGIDFLHLVESRLANLDIFTTLFGVAAFLFCVFDRDVATLSGGQRPRWGLGLLVPSWRLAAGLAAGAAIASKWSGLLVLVGVIVLTVAWAIAADRDFEPRRPTWRGMRAEVPSLAVAFLVLPAAVYLAAHVGRLDGSLLAWPWHQDSWFREFIGRQKYIATYHLYLTDVNQGGSPAWSWLLLKRPVTYYFQAAGGRYVEILALGSPLVWWSSLLALGFVMVAWLRRSDRTGSEGVILVGFAASYLPWLTNPRPVAYLYYILPSVPFMCLAVAYMASRLTGRVTSRVALAVGMVATIALFAFYYPVLAAVPISPQAWRTRMLFRDCPTSGPAEAARVQQVHPPAGWCWY